MEWARGSGISLRYQVSGEGVSLVLLHELGGSLESWKDTVAALPAGIRVLRYDQRGAGLSEKPRQPFTLDDQVHDLEAVLTAAELPAPLWLVSAAAGATVALRFAGTHPDRVAGLVLCAPAVEVDADRRAYLLERSVAAAEKGMRGIIDATLERSLPESQVPNRELYQRYRSIFLANDPVAYGFANRALATADSSLLGTGVRVPVLLLAGATDTLRPVPQVRALAERMASARMEIVEAGHLMHVERGTEIAGRLVEFMQENGVTTGNGKAEPADCACFVKANSIRLHCKLEGVAGAPWMVFANSLATELSVWNDVAVAFASRYRILRYDQRGHGRSEVPPGPYTFDMLTEDAAALLEHFDVKDAVFAGVSMGAVTALRLAERFPGRLSAVVACDGQPSSPAGNAGIWDERMNRAMTEGMEALVDPTIQRWFPQAFLASHSSKLDAVRTMIRDTPAEGYVASAQALLDYDLRIGFTKILLPVLLLAGAEDGVLPAAMRALAATMTSAQYVEISGAGHLPNFQDPARVVAAMEAFLAAVQAGSGE